MSLNARDWNAFRATFDDSISVFFEQPAPPRRFDGRAAVEEMFRRIFPVPGEAPRELPPAIRPVNLRVQDYGDAVVVSFEFPEGEQVARRTVVLHHGPGGWRVVHIHGSARPAAPR